MSYFVFVVGRGGGGGRVKEEASRQMSSFESKLEANEVFVHRCEPWYLSTHSAVADSSVVGCNQRSVRHLAFRADNRPHGQPTRSFNEGLGSAVPQVAVMEPLVLTLEHNR